MHSPTPFFSIIVAVYNGAATLQRCLASVQSQTYSDCELIVIDGGSDDGTISILKNSSALITYWISEPDRGIYDAWNKALAKSAGQWILFLGADDYLLSSNTLETIAPRLRTAYPPFRIAYGRAALLDRGGNTVRFAGEPWERVESRKADCMPFPHQATFHHRSLFSEHGTFDISFRICGDHDLLLREASHNPPLFLDIPVSAMSWGGVSTNPAYALRSLQERFKVRRKHNLGPLSPLLLRHTIGEAFFAILGTVASNRTSANLRRLYKRFLGRPT